MSKLRSLADEEDDIITDPVLARELGVSVMSGTLGSDGGGIPSASPGWVWILAVGVVYALYKAMGTFPSIPFRQHHRY